MPTSRTLKYKSGVFGNSYYRDLGNDNAVICIKGLREHIVLPVGSPTKLRVVTTRERPGHEEYFNIRPNGRLRDVRTKLTTNFKDWLYNRFQAGDRFVYFDYEE